MKSRLIYIKYIGIVAFKLLELQNLLISQKESFILLIKSATPLTATTGDYFYDENRIYTD